MALEKDFTLSYNNHSFHLNKYIDLNLGSTKEQEVFEQTVVRQIFKQRSWATVNIYLLISISSIITIIFSLLV